MALVVAAVVGAGLVGGLVNALLVDNTFGKEKTGRSGWVLAIVTNMVFGAVAAWLSWAAYGPLSAYPVFGPAPAGAPEPISTFTWSAFATAIVVGIGGPRWISNEVDKKLLTAAASKAADRPAHHATSQNILSARPAEVKRLAETMPG
jgi:hypothetical protein